ncbi:MAG: aminotransferase class IV [Phycisphaerae bacterium]
MLRTMADRSSILYHYSMTGKNVYLNGKIVPAELGRVSVYDAGLLIGYSTFSTMYGRNGSVFRLEQHLDRVFDTAEMLHIQLTSTREDFRNAIPKLLEINELVEARVRLTVTPGPARASGATEIITADPLPEYPSEWYRDGIAVDIGKHRQLAGDVTYGHKTGNYLPRVLAHRDAASHGFQERLWFTADGHLAEGCMSNVFLVSDGTVQTPPLDTPVLKGICRNAVLEVCEALGVPVDTETHLTSMDLNEADEAFLTGSTAGVRPVVKVGRGSVGHGTPGPVTRRIMQRYAEMIDAECGRIE